MREAKEKPTDMCSQDACFFLVGSLSLLLCLLVSLRVCGARGRGLMGICIAVPSCRRQE